MTSWVLDKRFPCFLLLLLNLFQGMQLVCGLVDEKIICSKCWLSEISVKILIVYCKHGLRPDHFQYSDIVVKYLLWPCIHSFIWWNEHKSKSRYQTVNELTMHICLHMCVCVCLSVKPISHVDTESFLIFSKHLVDQVQQPQRQVTMNCY